jgi:hypothetical protein
VIDELEPLVVEGGVVLDWHTCGIFPERWVDLVVVLRCDHSVLWERLEKRWVFLSSQKDPGKQRSGDTSDGPGRSERIIRRRGSGRIEE